MRIKLESKKEKAREEKEKARKAAAALQHQLGMAAANGEGSRASAAGTEGLSKKAAQRKKKKEKLAQPAAARGHGPDLGSGPGPGPASTPAVPIEPMSDEELARRLQAEEGGVPATLADEGAARRLQAEEDRYKTAQRAGSRPRTRGRAPASAPRPSNPSNPSNRRRGDTRCARAEGPPRAAAVRRRPTPATSAAGSSRQLSARASARRVRGRRASAAAARHPAASRGDRTADAERSSAPRHGSHLRAPQVRARLVGSVHGYARARPRAPPPPPFGHSAPPLGAPPPLPPGPRPGGFLGTQPPLPPGAPPQPKRPFAEIDQLFRVDRRGARSLQSARTLRRDHRTPVGRRFHRRRSRPRRCAPHATHPARALVGRELALRIGRVSGVVVWTRDGDDRGRAESVDESVAAARSRPARERPRGPTTEAVRGDDASRARTQPVRQRVRRRFDPYGDVSNPYARIRRTAAPGASSAAADVRRRRNVDDPVVSARGRRRRRLRSRWARRREKVGPDSAG